MDKNRVMEFLETDEQGVKWLRVKQDTHFSKGLNTWKQVSLPKEIKAHQDRNLTDDDLFEIKKAKFQEQLDMKRKVKHLKMKCDEVGLDAFVPSEVLMGVLKELPLEQAEETIGTLNDYYSEMFNQMVTKEVASRLPDTTPRNDGQKGQDNGGGVTKAQLLKMDYSERAKAYQQSPEHFNQVMKG